MSVRYRFKAFFFDKAAVLKEMDATAAKALSKFGAFVMRRARTSMRRVGKRGAPYAARGTPPRARSGELRDLLFFAWDPATKSVVVGPVPFSKGVAPSLHEFGGTQAVRAGLGGKARTTRYAPRPFMGPALEKELAAGTMKNAWANSIRTR